MIKMLCLAVFSLSLAACTRASVVVHNADVTATAEGYGDSAEMIRAATDAATKRNDSDTRKECLANGTCIVPFGGGAYGTGTTFIRSTQTQGIRRPGAVAPGVPKSKLAAKSRVTRKEVLQTFERADDAAEQSAETAEKVEKLEAQVSNMRTVLKAMRPEE